MMRRMWCLTIALLLAGAHAANAQRFVTLGMPDSEVLAAVKKFQQAIAAGDRATVASMVHYPLRFNRGPDNHTTFATRAELLRRYDAVFTPEVRRAVVADKLSDLLGSTDGLPIGRGVVWLNSTCSTTRPRTCTLGVISVNQRK